MSLFVDEQYARALGSEVPVAPGEHRHDDRAKIAALLSQNIFVARRPFAVAATLQEAGSTRPLKRRVSMLGAMFRLFWNWSKRVNPCKASRIIRMLPPLADPLEAASNGTGHLTEAFSLHRVDVHPVTIMMQVTCHESALTFPCNLSKRQSPKLSHH